jgi:exonuclease VII small subunit
MATDGMKQRMRALEKRIVKLEKAAVLFEQHRQSWIECNKGLKKLKQEMDRDSRKQLERDKSLQKNLDLVRAATVAHPEPSAVRGMECFTLKEFEADVEAVFRKAVRAPTMITKDGREHLVVLSISDYRLLSIAAKRTGNLGR